MKTINSCTAYAHANIALIKYWGKFNLEHNIPLVSSLSLTLDGYGTKTRLSAIDEEHDRFILNGNTEIGPPAIKVQRFLDYVRAQSGSTVRCQIESFNNFPTKSGLASSASGFAALAVAANSAYKLQLDPQALSRLARRGSASAARSIFDGLAILHGGPISEQDAYAEKIKDCLDLSLVIVQCADTEKTVSSTDGMVASAKYSPFFPIFVDHQPHDLEAALYAIESGNLSLLGETMEFSTLKMHSCCLTSRPGFWYWNPTTIRVMDAVTELRRQGAQCYFTMDAGPHVKVLCPKSESQHIMDSLKSIEGIKSIDVAGPGPGAYIMSEH